MSVDLRAPELRELKPRIMVCGVGGAGGNAVNNMINSGLMGVDVIVATTDAQALASSRADRIIQMGLQVTEGLGAGSQPEVGRAAAEEALEEIRDHLSGAHMCFVTAGMGGGTGTGAAPVIAQAAREMGILTVGVVTKPFQFEGQRRMRLAEGGITELHKAVDTLIIIPNQNLFRVANERTTFADAFAMADQVLYSGVACITDLMVKEGLINLDFADVRAVMREMGKAMMGTGEASGDRRAVLAAEAAIANPLLDETSMRGARGLLISITGGSDLTLFEVDEAASRIRQEVDDEANIILGATFDESLNGIVRVSVVATGIDRIADAREFNAAEMRIAEAAHKLRAHAASRAVETETRSAPLEINTYSAPALTHEAPAPAPQQAAQPVQQQPVYQQAPQQQIAQAAVVQLLQSAPRVIDEVMLHPVPPRQMQVYVPQDQQSPPPSYPAPAPYVPPTAEQPLRASRMPRVEDLPVPAQRQIQAQREGASASDAKRRTLFERLASFRSGHQTPAPLTAAGPLVAPLRPVPAAPVQQRQQPAPNPVHAEYAKRPSAPGPGAAVQNGARPQPPQLDLHGRPAAPQQQRSVEDDQLEIPAFLRRQSN